VRDVAVVGVPSAEWGEEVKGVVEHVAGEPPRPELEEALIEFCRSHLARFKCPRSIDIVDELPRSDNGKLYKRRLREHYRGGLDA
jgi:acyl-CoA synthetase (AMP-forming)/AMP-acid ligase II